MLVVVMIEPYSFRMKHVGFVFLSLVVLALCASERVHAQGMACGFDQIGDLGDLWTTGARFEGSTMTLFSNNVVMRYDMQDPGSPELIEEFALPRTLRHLRFVGDLALGMQTGRLYIYDISDRDAPVELGAHSISSVNGIEVLGDYVYIARDFPPAEQGVHVADISNPGQYPTLMNLGPEADGQSIKREGDLLYATSETHGLVMYDLSDPATPELIQSDPVDYDGQILSITIDDGILYGYQYGSSIITIDVRDPEHPVYLDRVEFERAFTGFGLMGDWIYASDLQNAVMLVDRTDPANLQRRMTYELDNDIDFISAGAGAVVIYERGVGTSLFSPAGSDPVGDPIMELETGLFGFALDGTLMYQLFEHELRIFERGEQGDYTLVGTYASDYSMRGIALGDGVAFITLGSSGLMSLDVSDPASPSLLAVQALEHSVYGIDLVDDLLYVYASGASWMWTVDVSDPAQPYIVAYFEDSFDAKQVIVIDDIAYIPEGRSGLKIYDVSDRENPETIGQYDTTFDAYSVAIVDQIAYLPHSFTISAIDISDPTDPVLLSDTFSRDRVKKVIARNGILYARTDGGELLAFDLSDPTTPVFVSELAGLLMLTNQDDLLYTLRLDAANWIYELIGVDISNDCSPCVSDLNGDGVSNFFDVSAFVALFGSGDLGADLNGDGMLNFFDVSAFLVAFGAGCP